MIHIIETTIGDFLKSRDQDRQLTYAAAKVAEPSLNKVWDNPDDAVYDSL